MKTASMAQNEYGERVIRITFHYDMDTIMQSRTLPGRKYHPEEKVWSAPVHIETLDLLSEWNFILDDKLKTFIEKSKKRKDEIVSLGIPELKGKLFPFQVRGVAFLEDKNGRALIADEQGLGKTIEALAWLQLHQEKRPAIIVVPASVKLNWKKEAELWMTNTNIEILSGTKAKKIKGNIVIINYDILFAWIEKIREKNPSVLILDEIHYTKSSKAKRTKAVKMLGKNIPHIIGLSGTPIINRPIEAFNTLKLIAPDLFPNFVEYTRLYCRPKWNGFGWDYSGSSNEKELHDKLIKTVMLRRLKSEVLTDLPDKIRSFIPIELDNSQDYKNAEIDFISYIRKEKGAEAAKNIERIEAMAKVEGLKQLAVKGKMKNAISWIQDFLETDNKLVIFATHHFVIDILMETFADIAVKIDGSVSQNNRQKAVDDFQTNEKIKLFVGNIQAAGIGITLTAASNVAFLELPWSPMLVEQAIDRLHRITQKFTVNAYFLLAIGTIEDRIAKILDMKRKTVDYIMDGIESENNSLIMELIKEYQETKT
jgi:SWI/SNF-related matrix-associated actin-dependent regulator of chromatin subfamily A-like protein 1